MGQRLYGVRWARPMAAAIGVSPALLLLVVHGKRPVTQDLGERAPQVFEHCRRELEEAMSNFDAAIREHGEN